VKKMQSKIIGTLSLNINTPDFNYGAILHSWAFQQYLKKEKLCKYTEIIDYVTPKLEKFNYTNPIKNGIKSKKIKSIIKSMLIYPIYKSKYKKIHNFINKEMNISQKKFTQKMLNDEKLVYDTIICESDVIWSPGFFGGKFDKSFFMNLDSMKNMKKIAYSPSMANTTLTSNQKKELAEYLKSIDYISSRETYNKDMIQKYTEKKVEHVLDPVLLLDEQHYSKITGKKLIDEEYLLLYLPVDNNKKLRENAKEYAKLHNLKIIEITTTCLPTLRKNTLNKAGVEDFLSAIKYANTIFTNSFHAICFSIIFNKNFYVFSRKNSGKIKDICDVMNIPERYFTDDNFVELKQLDYKKINNTWKRLKNKSENWLKDALEK